MNDVVIRRNKQYIALCWKADIREKGMEKKKY